MIQKLKNIPTTMIGFEARQELTKEDFDLIILPAVAELIQRTDKLNFLLIMDAEFESFVIGAWLNEAMHKLNLMSKWNRVAVITNTKVIKSFSNLFEKIAPGEFRGFNQNEIREAIEWVADKTITDSKLLEEHRHSN